LYEWRVIQPEHRNGVARGADYTSTWIDI